MKSPDYGPLPPGSPNWCGAPFDPEGLLRLALGTLTLHKFSLVVVEL